MSLNGHETPRARRLRELFELEPEKARRILEGDARMRAAYDAVDEYLREATGVIPGEPPAGEETAP